MHSVSFIVPVYNNGKTIARTLSSLEAQTCPEKEYILVNDGSTDDSEAILEAWCQEHEEAVLVSLPENGGVGAARNAGLSLAKGTYIRFVDGDDTIPSDSTEEMIHTMEKEGADLVVGGMSRVSLLGSHPFKKMEKQAAKKEMKPHDTAMIASFSVCNKLFKRAIIRDNGLLFGDFHHVEDGVFLFDYLNHIDKVSGCDRVVYEYYRPLFIEGKTSSQKLTGKSLENTLEALAAIKEETAGAPKIFRNELHAKLLGITLLHECYRKLWKWDESSLTLLFREIRNYMDEIDPKRWGKILLQHHDLKLRRGPRTKNQWIKDPLVNVVLSPNLSVEETETVLRSLYDQLVPGFTVILDREDLAALPMDLRFMPNLDGVDAKSEGDLFHKALRYGNGEYIQFVTHPVLYADDALRMMLRAFVTRPAWMVEGDMYVQGWNGESANTKPAGEAAAEKLPQNIGLSARLYKAAPLRKTTNKGRDFMIDPAEAVLARAVPEKKCRSIGNGRFLYMGDTPAEFEGANNTKSADRKTAGKAAGQGNPAAAKGRATGKNPPIAGVAGKAAAVTKNAGKVAGRATTLAKTFWEAAAFTRFSRAAKRHEKVRDDLVLFLSDERKELGGNLKCIYDNLPEGLTPMVFLRDGHRNVDGPRRLSELAKAMSSAKYILLEDFYRHTSYQVFTPEQQLCQLWHACGAFKKFGYSRQKDGEKKRIHSGYKKYTKVIVSSEAIRGDYAEAFGVDVSKVKATGIPRTDLFFDETAMEEKRRALYEKYPVLEKKKVILFAPTYRGDRADDAAYDFEMLDPETLYRELGEDYVFVFKWHPSAYRNLKREEKEAYQTGKYGDFFLDLSEERDINDLLLVTDVLVTDYSSVIFDYSLLNKPIVYYAYDRQEYGAGRGWYYDFEEYLYGPVATDLSRLIEAIREEDMCREMRGRFHDKFMEACDGHATEKTIAWLFEE